MTNSNSISLPILNLPHAGCDSDPLAALRGREGSVRDRKPLPMTLAEAQARGWDEVDVVFITGDAYIDHPSFAMAILGRVLEAGGFRVGIVSQPDWRSCDAWRTFGKPKLFFAISAGNMDSMINHYTANRKVRNDDAYSPGGRIGLRPDRATLGYCQRAREAYPGVPVIAGGVEASLRSASRTTITGATKFAVRFCWMPRLTLSDSVWAKTPFWRLLDDLQLAKPCETFATCEAWRTFLGAKESEERFGAPGSEPTYLRLPSFETGGIRQDAFAEATKIIHNETNPYNAMGLVQFHDRQAVVCNPPRLPISKMAMDSIYGLPYTRRPHPSYTEKIPAFEMIKDSVTIMRGCFGGCTFCSITTHQGRIIQSRSHDSVIGEIEEMTQDPQFKGVISDIGGPTANMYEMRCSRPEVEAKCRRQSCVHPTICKLLGTDHGPLVKLMKDARETPGIKKVFVASGIRMDLARRSPEYMKDLVRHHVGGHLKVAPEHSDAGVLDLMRKPASDDFDQVRRSV
jgi:radical SAM superfamily enzyme YgiQ (UPF0313 family)